LAQHRRRLAHEKGDGFNVVLQALPLHGNGKLVMRAYDPEAPVPPEGEKRADAIGAALTPKKAHGQQDGCAGQFLAAR